MGLIFTRFRNLIFIVLLFFSAILSFILGDFSYLIENPSEYGFITKVIIFCHKFIPFLLIYGLANTINNGWQMNRMIRYQRRVRFYIHFFARIYGYFYLFMGISLLLACLLQEVSINTTKIVLILSAYFTIVTISLLFESLGNYTGSLFFPAFCIGLGLFLDIEILNPFFLVIDKKDNLIQIIGYVIAALLSFITLCSILQRKNYYGGKNDNS